MSDGATFLWTVPSQMNGPLREFQLVSYQNRSEAVEWTGTETQAHLASLSAYHRYDNFCVVILPSVLKYLYFMPVET